MSKWFMNDYEKDWEWYRHKDNPLDCILSYQTTCGDNFVGWVLLLNGQSYKNKDIHKLEVKEAQIWAERVKQVKDSLNLLVERYGEEYRNLIESATDFLIEREASWGLAKPMNVDEYIDKIIEAAKRK